MKKAIILFFCFALSCSLRAETKAENQNKLPVLTLEEALQKAVTSNKSFLVLKKQKKISDSKIRLAKQSPVPEISLGVEDIAGSGEYKNTSSMKSSIALKKTFETGGKKAKRINAAKTSKDIEDLKIQIAEKELKLKVVDNFFKIYRLSKDLKLHEEAISIASQTADRVNKKVLAGELASIDATRAYVEFTKAKTEKRQLELDLYSAKNELAMLWNTDSLDFNDIEINTKYFTEEKYLSPSEIDINDIPEIAIGKARIKEAKTDEKIARAEKNPNVDLSLAYSKYKATSDHALELEASFPLVGHSWVENAKAAKTNLEAVELEAKGDSSEFLLRLETAYKNLEILKEEVASLESVLLPASKKAFDETQMAFDCGEKSLLDLFDARKALIETTDLHLELQCKLFKAICEYAILSNQE